MINEITNEKAIERIKAALDMDDIYGHCYILTKDVDRKAFHLAIKALEQQPILDKIRTEIEKLKNAPPCFDDMFEYRCAVDDVLAIIDKYKAEPQESEEEK